MAQITKKQIDTINAKCQNGFHFYIRGFQESGKKYLIKTIIVKEEEKVVEIQLYWADEIIRKKNEHGCSVPRYTGNVIPQVLVSVWKKKKEAQCWGSNGAGTYHRFTEYPCNKKMMTKLCEVTEFVTDDLIRSLLPEYEREECMPTKTELLTIK